MRCFPMKPLTEYNLRYRSGLPYERLDITGLFDVLSYFWLLFRSGRVNCSSADEKLLRALAINDLRGARGEKESIDSRIAGDWSLRIQMKRSVKSNDLIIDRGVGSLLRLLPIGLDELINGLNLVRLYQRIVNCSFYVSINFYSLCFSDCDICV